MRQSTSRAPSRRDGRRELVMALALASVAVLGCGGEPGNGPLGGGGGGGSPDGCTSNLQCTADHDGLPFVCVQPGQPCVSLSNQHCPEVVGDWTSDQLIVFGHLQTRSGAFAFTSPHHQAEAAAAQKELATALGALPGPEGASRSLVQVSCDAAADPEGAARFLVEELGVRVLIGGTTPEAALTVVEKVTDEAGALFIGDAAIEGLGKSGLVWSLSPGARTWVEAYPLLIDEMAGEARARKGLEPGDPIKLVVLASEAAGQQALKQRLLAHPGFQINGKPWSAAAGEGHFVLVEYADPEGGAPVDYASAVSKILAEAPDVIVAFSGPELHEKLTGPIEDGFVANAAGPEWLLPAEPPGSLAVFAQPEGRRERVRQLRPLETEPSEFGGARYLSVYALAYAYMARWNHVAPTGHELAASLVELVNSPGLPVAVGPADIAAAKKALLEGTDIDLQGASGNVELDPTTGTAFDFRESRVFCVSSLTLDWVHAGQAYDPLTSTLKGSFSCP